MASVSVTLNAVLIHKPVSAEGYCTLRVGRDYAWGPQFKSRYANVNRNVTPRRVDFNEAFTLPVKSPAQDVLQVEYHERGLLSSDIVGSVEHSVASFTMGSPQTLTINGRNITAIVTVVANGFGVPAPIQQVVQQTTYQVAPPPQVYVTTQAAPTYAVDPYGNPIAVQAPRPVDPYGNPIAVQAPPANPNANPYAQPQVYGQPPQTYAQPQQVYGQPQQVYGQPQQVYAAQSPYPPSPQVQPVYVQQTYVQQPPPQQVTTTTTTYQAQPQPQPVVIQSTSNHHSRAGKLNLDINPFKGPSPTLF